MLGIKYELCLSLSNYFLFSIYGHAKIFFSYLILMNSLIYTLFCEKKSLNNIPYRQVSNNISN